MSQGEEGEKNAAGAGEAPRRRRRWIRLVRVAASLALFLLLLPHGIRWGIQRWLSEHGAGEVRIENVDFNPFTGYLAIFDLRVQGTGADGLTCKRVTVNFDWLPLVKKRLELARMQLVALEFDARPLEDGGWRLGGLTLPRTEKEGEWHWGVGSADLRDLAVDLHTKKLDERFAVEQLHLANLYSWEGADATPFRLELKAFGGELVLTGRGRPFSTPMSVEAALEVKGMALKRLEPFVETSIGGDLALNIAIQAQKRGDTGALQIEADGGAGIAGLRLAVGDLLLSGEKFDWTGLFRFTGGENGKWAVDGDFGGEAMSLDDPGEGLNMVRAAGFSIKGGHVESEGLAIASARLSGLEAFERPGGSAALAEGGDPLERSSHLLAAPRLDLGAMRFNDKVVRFEKGVFQSAKILLARRPEVGLEVGVWLDGEDEKTPEGKGAEEEEDDDGPYLQIEDLQLNESRLLFVDRTVSPLVRLDARPLHLHVESLDEAAPQKRSSVGLGAKIDEYASVHLEGTVRPFGDSFDMDVKGKIDSLNLPSLSPYAERYLDYRVEQGHLDASLNWRVDNWQLDAANDLKIGKLRVASLKDDEKSRLTAILGLRVSTALPLLRDRQDNIEIELPFSGDLRDPRFEFDQVVVKAVRKAVQEATVFYYAPLGLSLLTGVPFPPGSVTIADRVIDWMTSVRFDPVTFEPGSSELNEKARDYLKKVIDSLEEKDDLRIVLCGRAGVADLGGEKPWSEAVRRRLIDLARERSLAVKDDLVTAGIKADRLFLCKPQVGEGEQVEPRVDIYL